MITQPYTRLVLTSSEVEPMDESSPATPLGDANAVQLTIVAYEVTGSLTVRLQVSNDAENWTDHSANELRTTSMGIFVMSPDTQICTRYVRVRADVAEGQAILGVDQYALKL